MALDALAETNESPIGRGSLTTTLVAGSNRALLATIVNDVVTNARFQVAGRMREIRLISGGLRTTLAVLFDLALKRSGDHGGHGLVPGDSTER